MNLSSILADTTPAENGSPSRNTRISDLLSTTDGSVESVRNGVPLTTATSENGHTLPPMTTLTQSLGVLVPKAEPVSDDEVENDVSRAYLADFEARVSAINNVDRVLVDASNLNILSYEQKSLQALVAKTADIANNYVERVVTDELVLGDTPQSDRDFQWGSTRSSPKEELAKARKQASRAKTVPKKRTILEEDEPSKLKQNRGPFEAPIDEDAPRKRRRRPTYLGEDFLQFEEGDNESDDPEDPVAAAAAAADKAKTTKEQRSMTKQYDNTFVAIWKDMSRKDGPKVARLIQQSNQARMINLKKTSILASREAKRWQMKNNKNQKDLTTKARRAMREMFNFWKRNERVERDLRKRHEREMIDKAKKEEEEREAKRQSRKLNFLITQTELYSHFIGKKIRTEEIEGLDRDPNAPTLKPTEGLDKYLGVTGKSTEFTSIDFDNDDEEALNSMAAGNAQVALEAARSKAQAFDEPLKNPDTNGEEMNFQNPTMLGDINILQSSLLKCTLKEYQVKGLNWLANLYEQGINGILADEMGLGKTVQSISVLAYLAETHNIWGPYLVVTPASTLHNWQQEITKFVPEFKVLPYWGNSKDRKILRKFWDRKNVRYGKDAPFHVLVTSYQLVVADAAYFQKMRWQYMILDEAQAIKLSQSLRWKLLLSFQCRNRLLLTGTPIQNSMQELWALLHFIMPSLFDLHDEFSDWFSKDIESHAQSNTQLNEQQLKRLHVILKPFMLRRIKKNVQSELGDKVEIDLFCDLTNRQKKYYLMLKLQISIMDILDTSLLSEDTQLLMNLVMQFRKVCNHPDLFERADVKSSFSFGLFAETLSFARENGDLEVAYLTQNHIQYRVPRLLYDEMLAPAENNDVGSRNKIFEMFNIYHPLNAPEEPSFLRLAGVSPQELNHKAHQTILQRAIGLREYSDVNYERLARCNYIYEGSFVPESARLLICDYLSTAPQIANSEHLRGLYEVQKTVYERLYINVLQPAAEPVACAPPVSASLGTWAANEKIKDTLFDPEVRAGLMPMPLSTESQLLKQQVPVSQFPKADMLPKTVNKLIDYSNIRMPSMNRFITESGKLAKLDQLLVKLKNEDHRVLVYFQMTKMMDLMEEYLTYRQHKYIRLDGSSKLDDRRDLVHDWQTKPEIFVFLLSTRAGGLGINLTAADTVIFYDSDWNPTIDLQAMDRAHRLGQTKQVTVYRLLARGTIEERMRDRAKQKEQVQQVVMEGKASLMNKKEESANKKKDVAFLLLGGDEPEASSVGSKSRDETPLGNTPLLNNRSLEEMYHEGEGEFSGNITPSA